MAITTTYNVPVQHLKVGGTKSQRPYSIEPLILKLCLPVFCPEKKKKSIYSFSFLSYHSQETVSTPAGSRVYITPIPLPLFEEEQDRCFRDKVLNFPSFLSFSLHLRHILDPPLVVLNIFPHPGEHLLSIGCWLKRVIPLIIAVLPFPEIPFSIFCTFPKKPFLYVW